MSPETRGLARLLALAGLFTPLACSNVAENPASGAAGTTLGRGGSAAEGGATGPAEGGKSAEGSAGDSANGGRDLPTAGSSSAGAGGAAATAGADGAGSPSSGGALHTGGQKDAAGQGGLNALGGAAGSSNGGKAPTGGALPNGGAAGSAQAGIGASAGAGGVEIIPKGYVPGIVGVGYGGLRVVSRDAGLTWGSRASLAANGGDDDNLIRAVTYGKGRWLATGWKLWSSEDGVTWTDHGKLHDGIISDQQIVEGLAYADGYFYAAGDGNPSRLYRSTDGLAWTRYAEIGNTVKHTGLAYRDGLFVSYGDSHTSYQSSDAQHWTEMSGIEDATYCEGRWKSLKECFDAAWFDAGFYLLDEWGGYIRRSTTGQGFKNVYADDQKNTLYRSRALAQGYVAPE